MESLFSVPFTYFNSKAPAPLTSILQLLAKSKDPVSETDISEQQEEDEEKISKIIEVIGKGEQPNNATQYTPSMLIKVLKKYFEKQEKIVDDSILEQIFNLSQNDYDKTQYQQSLSSIPRYSMPILAYVCIFNHQNKNILSEESGAQIFGPLLAKCDESNIKYLIPLIQNAEDLFSDFSLDGLTCNEDDIANAFKPAYNEEYVQRMRKRVARRKKDTLLSIASCESALVSGLKRPEGRPQEFANIDHDYEYGDGELDDETEEVNMNYKYQEADEYEYDYEYEIEG